MYQLLTIKDVDYKLRLTFNALAEFKALNSGNGFVALLEGREDLDFPEIRLLVHVALKHGEKDYENTIHQTGELLQDLIEEEGFLALQDIVSKLMEQLQGKKKQPQDHLVAQVQEK